MASNESFGFDPEDLDRLLRGAGDQLRGVFGGLFDGKDKSGWSTIFDDARRSPRSSSGPDTAGKTGDGVWAIYTVDAAGNAVIEQVHATELDALRANQDNTDSRRKVRFLPYGIAATVLDAPETPDTPDAPDAPGGSMTGDEPV